jgi:hypothetical protein
VGQFRAEPMLRVFVPCIPTRFLPSLTACCTVDESPIPPTLNFAKNAKFRMGHPAIAAAKHCPWHHPARAGRSLLHLLHLKRTGGPFKPDFGLSGAVLLLDRVFVPGAPHLCHDPSLVLLYRGQETRSQSAPTPTPSQTANTATRHPSRSATLPHPRI